MYPKRLFLFAGYNQKNLVDDALVYYVKELATCGDIVLVMDCDCPQSELNKISHIPLHTLASRHGEYDFGSYKHAYIWAKENLNLNEYDYIYLVNDSVYGPMFPIQQYLEQMESLPDAAFGIVGNPHKHHPHIQSWFIGIRPCVFTTAWFDEFMCTITRLKDKGTITRKYEQGFSKMIIDNGQTWSCLYTVARRGVYNLVKKLYIKKMPFMKRVAFTRTHGALGGQISYVLAQLSPELRNAILTSTTALYGEKYIKWLLTRNPLRIMIRNIHHAIFKLSSGRI
jgi:lipopolysaccharide biosynthesis protein